MDSTKKFLKSLYDLMAKRTREAECQFYVLGLMIIVGYLLFYLMWYETKAQAYENLTIRLIASLLGLSFILKKHLPKKFLSFFPLYWYLSLAYLFPFFYSFMMLKNNFSTLWQLYSLVSLTILVILVDWLSAVILIVVGVSIGWIAYAMTTANPQLPLADLENIITCYISIIAFGGFFVHNNNRFQDEKISALNNFTDMIAHEMRTPLVSLNMIGTNLKRWLTPLLETYEIASQHQLEIPHIDKRVRSKLLDNVASIGMESTQAQQIINMLLANVEDKKIINTQLKIYRIADLVNDALDRYAFDLSDRKLITFDAAHNFILKADDSFINVIFNLLKNSIHQIKASSKGSIVIWTIESTGFNELHFKDTAKGVSKQKLANLFRPFFGDTRHGVGLGLAFCKMVMESYGGSIDCYSVEGEYAEFILSFPKITEN